ASGADLGVIFDTDVDRAASMDKNGESLNRTPLIAVISSIILEEKPGTTIVTASTTSGHLQAFIEAKGGTQHRFKRGYRNVINE
ncbi:phosphomannomutase/phosphoglucomutase, partial [Listeria monocytogenes]|nr:phosphomannomutase/phosphoglucomutase [Listeria monocytogenes]